MTSSNSTGVPALIMPDLFYFANGVKIHMKQAEELSLYIDSIAILNNDKKTLPTKSSYGWVFKGFHCKDYLYPDLLGDLRAMARAKLGICATHFRAAYTKGRTKAPIILDEENFQRFRAAVTAKKTAERAKLALVLFADPCSANVRFECVFDERYLVKKKHSAKKQTKKKMSANVRKLAVQTGIPGVADLDFDGAEDQSEMFGHYCDVLPDLFPVLHAYPGVCVKYAGLCAKGTATPSKMPPVIVSALRAQEDVGENKWTPRRNSNTSSISNSNRSSNQNFMKKRDSSYYKRGADSEDSDVGPGFFRSPPLKRKKNAPLSNAKIEFLIENAVETAVEGAVTFAVEIAVESAVGKAVEKAVKQEFSNLKDWMSKNK